MDRREAMSFSGSTYYMQRGMPESGSGTGVQGSPGIPLSNLNVSFQSNIGGSSIGSAMPIEPSLAISHHGVDVGSPSAMPSTEPVRRKRGRPRKYGPDESHGTVALALSPTSSNPPVTTTPNQKRGRGRPPGTGRKQQLASLGHHDKNYVLFSTGPKSYMHFVSQWFRLHCNFSSALNFWWHCDI